MQWRAEVRLKEIAQLQVCGCEHVCAARMVRTVGIAGVSMNIGWLGSGVSIG